MLLFNFLLYSLHLLQMESQLCSLIRFRLTFFSKKYFKVNVVLYIASYQEGHQRLGSHLRWCYVWRLSLGGGCRFLHHKVTCPFCNEYVNYGVTFGHHCDILFLTNISPNIFSIHCGSFPQLFILSIFLAFLEQLTMYCALFQGFYLYFL